MSAALAGSVQTGAVLTMAAGSPAGARMGKRSGRERALGGAVGLVVVGSLVRGVPSVGTVFAGTLPAGFGIGLAGVLLAGVVKEVW